MGISALRKSLVEMIYVHAAAANCLSDAACDLASTTGRIGMTTFRE
jgi:hypothetical protein